MMSAPSRSSRVAGNAGHRHRIVRRGIPYGPPYDPAHPLGSEDRVEYTIIGDGVVWLATVTIVMRDMVASSVGANAGCSRFLTTKRRSEPRSRKRCTGSATW